MLFWEHYQTNPDRFGNYRLEPYRFGYALNGRYRLRFFKRAERFMQREDRFIKRFGVWHRFSEVMEWTFESKANGYVFRPLSALEVFQSLLGELTGFFPRIDRIFPSSTSKRNLRVRA